MFGWWSGLAECQIQKGDTAGASLCYSFPTALHSPTVPSLTAHHSVIGAACRRSPPRHHVGLKPTRASLLLPLRSIKMTSSTTSRWDWCLCHMKNGRPQLTMAGCHYHRQQQGGVSAGATLLLAWWIVLALKGAAACHCRSSVFICTPLLRHRSFVQCNSYTLTGLKPIYELISQYKSLWVSIHVNGVRGRMLGRAWEVHLSIAITLLTCLQWCHSKTLLNGKFSTATCSSYLTTMTPLLFCPVFVILSIHQSQIMLLCSLILFEHAP